MLTFSTTKHGNALLDILLHSNNPVPVTDLMEILHLSRRSVLYILKKIDSELAAQKMDSIKNIKGIGYFLTEETIQTLTDYKTVPQPGKGDFINNPTSLSYKITEIATVERKILINYLIICSNGISIQQFMDIFTVSRNTVLNELKAMHSYNQSFDFSIATTANGRIIRGNELSIRQWVWENFYAILSIIGKFAELTPNNAIYNQLKEYESTSAIRFTDDARRIISFFLSWYVNRLQAGKLLSATSSLAINEKQNTHCWAKHFLATYISENTAEINYLVKLMHVHPFSKLKNKDKLYYQLHEISQQLIKSFEQISGLTVSTEYNKDLLENLTVHMVSLYHRISNGIKYHNPLLEKLKSEYHNLFYLTRAAVKAQDANFWEMVSDDEIGLLATYFGSAMLKKKEIASSKRIVVICSSGIGTSQFLLLQLRERYPQLSFVGPLSIDDYKNISMDQVGMVITTAPPSEFPASEISVLSVSAVPSRYEWNVINKKLNEAGFIGKQLKENIDNLVDIISNYAKIEDIDGLTQGLNEYFYKQWERNFTVTVEESAIDTFMKYTTYTADNFSSWQDAISYAFRRLENGHFVEKRYTKKIINLLEKHGDYMAIGKGILLAHAKPQDGVLEGSVAITLFQNAINMPSGKQIRCIISLAPIDQNSHLYFLTMLLKKLNEPLWCNQLYAITSETELSEFLWGTLQ